MVSKSTIDRACGVLLLGVLASLIVFAVTGNKFDTYEESFSESLQEIVDNEALHVTSTVFSGVASVLLILLAGAMYLAFRPYERAMVLVGTLGFLAIGFIMLVATMAGIASAEMANEFEKASGGTATMIATSARPLDLIKEAAFIGPVVFLPLSLLAFGSVIVWSRTVPRWLGWLALASGVVMLGFWVNLWIVGIFGLMAAGLWFVLMGGWMLARGTGEEAAAVEPRLEVAPS